jgi:putative hydrolase of the HAD superfamily
MKKRLLVNSPSYNAIQATLRPCAVATQNVKPMGMNRFQALSFDLDETLLDGSGLQASIARCCQMIAAREPGLEASRLIATNGEIWTSYWPEVEREWEVGALDSSVLRREIWRRTLRACGCNDESIAELAARTHAELALEEHRLFDDARQLLTALTTVRVPLALITNGASDIQRDKLRVLEIEHCFEVVVISGEMGAAKPDRSVFALVLQLAVEPENIWHVGDSLTADVAGAKCAGLTSVWLNRNGLDRRESDPSPDLEIRALSDLMAFLPSDSI